MLCLDLISTDPYFNLAVDEYLLKNSIEDFLILGINQRSVIIGKHQVAHRETDTRFVTEQKIPVIRRISGGGTVFHDPGNLNFSFILKSQHGKQVDFRKYTLPVISFLSSVGVDAIFEGKNDLKVNGLKISGNAEHVYHDRVLHHGTLLFDADLDLLKGSIRKDTYKYHSRAVASNPSSVINLFPVLKTTFKYVDNIHEFKSLMLKWFLENFPGSEVSHLSHQEIDEIKLLAETKYRTWEWNYAYGPEYQFVNRFKVENKECFCKLSVKDGILLNCEITGHNESESISKKLTGCRHMVNDIREVFNNWKFLTSGFDIYNFF
jgi:lipoate-protein ligase A